MTVILTVVIIFYNDGGLGLSTYDLWLGSGSSMGVRMYNWDERANNTSLVSSTKLELQQIMNFILLGFN